MGMILGTEGSDDFNDKYDNPYFRAQFLAFSRVVKRKDILSAASTNCDIKEEDTNIQHPAPSSPPNLRNNASRHSAAPIRRHFFC